MFIRGRAAYRPVSPHNTNAPCLDGDSAFVVGVRHYAVGLRPRALSSPLSPNATGVGY